MEQNMVNYYELFGLPFNYTVEDLNNAYYHFTDRLRFMMASKDFSEEEEKQLKSEFELVKRAFYVLSNPTVKDAYDKKLLEYEKAKCEEARKQGPTVLYLYDSKKVKDPHYKRGYVYNPHGKSIRYPFLEKIKDSYKEVREEEMRLSFQKRRELVKEIYDEEHNIHRAGLGYKLGLGTLQVYSELYHQVSKLKKSNGDSATKYVLRNRQFLASVMAAGMILSGGLFLTNEAPKAEEVFEYVPPKVEVVAPVEEVKEVVPPKKVTITGSQIVLNRDYLIQKGDNLTTLAFNANSSKEDLKARNHLKNYTIYAGHHLTIPYTISKDNIEYYTDVVRVYNNTIERIAELYETDVDTLVRLNPEAIEFVDGQYLIISDSIVVPNFITKADLSEIKRKERFGK